MKPDWAIDKNKDFKLHCQQIRQELNKNYCQKIYKEIPSRLKKIIDVNRGHIET